MTSPSPFDYANFDEYYGSSSATTATAAATSSPTLLLASSTSNNVTAELTDVQEIVLTLLPIPSAILSIFGSIIIIYISFKNRRTKKWTPYTRLLLGMSISDIFSSIILSFTTFLRPADTSHRVWSFGNDTTCSVSGFFQQLSFIGMFYNGFLSFYFLAAARFGLSSLTIAKYIEPSMHFVSIGYPLITAIWGAVLGVYAEPQMGLGCWVNDYPRGCGLNIEAGESGEPCRSPLIAWIFGAIPSLTIFACIIINNLIIVIFVRRQTRGSIIKNDNKKLIRRRRNKKQQPQHNTINSCCKTMGERKDSPQPTIETCPTTTSGSSARKQSTTTTMMMITPPHPAVAVTNVVAQKQQRPLQLLHPPIVSECISEPDRTIVGFYGGNSSSSSLSLTSSPIRRSSNKVSIQSSSLSSSHNNIHNNNHHHGHQSIMSSQELWVSISDEDEFQKVDDDDEDDVEEEEDQEEDIVVGEATTQDQQHDINMNDPSSRSSTVKDCDDGDGDDDDEEAQGPPPPTSKQQLQQQANEDAIRKDQLKRLQLVKSQALLFVGSYFICNAWTSFLNLAETMATSVEHEFEIAVSVYWLSVLHAFFTPLQGLFNMMVFVRPKYLKARQEFPLESRYWAFQRIVFGESKILPTKFHHDDPQQDDEEGEGEEDPDKAMNNEQHVVNHHPQEEALEAAAAAPPPPPNDGGSDDLNGGFRNSSSHQSGGNNSKNSLPSLTDHDGHGLPSSTTSRSSNTNKSTNGGGGPVPATGGAAGGEPSPCSGSSSSSRSPFEGYVTRLPRCMISSITASQGDFDDDIEQHRTATLLPPNSSSDDRWGNNSNGEFSSQTPGSGEEAASGDGGRWGDGSGRSTGSSIDRWGNSSSGSGGGNMAAPEVLLSPRRPGKTKIDSAPKSPSKTKMAVDSAPKKSPSVFRWANNNNNNSSKSTNKRPPTAPPSKQQQQPKQQQKPDVMKTWIPIRNPNSSTLRSRGASSLEVISELTELSIFEPTSSTIVTPDQDDDDDVEEEEDKEVRRARRWSSGSSGSNNSSATSPSASSPVQPPPTATSTPSPSSSKSSLVLKIPIRVDSEVFLDNTTSLVDDDNDACGSIVVDRTKLDRMKLVGSTNSSAAGSADTPVRIPRRKLSPTDIIYY